MNDLFLRALRGESVPRPPVWFKRQAGRFLPSYQELRKEHTLSKLFHTPALAAKITKMPCDQLGVDAAILFSDILVIAEVLGYEVDFPSQGGIAIKPPGVAKNGDVATCLSYVFETIESVKPLLTVPLIGFCGGPYTVATYLKRVDHEMLQQLTDLSIAYLKLQICAGADAVEIFDSWAGHLTRPDFERLSLPYLKQMVNALKPLGKPVIIFCRGSCRYVPELVSIGATAISFDWEKEMSDLRKEVPAEMAIQGNLDPEIFRGPKELLEKKVEEILKAMEGERGFIFNLGHGVLPDTPVENARAVVQRIQK